MSDDLVKVSATGGPLPCPFCGGKNLRSGGDDKVVGYWCLDCEAMGPNHYGRYEWNTRADLVKERSDEVQAAEQRGYANAMEAERKLHEDRIEALEAKLAKAVWLLTDAAVQLEEGKIKTRRNRASFIWEFLEEIKGT